MDDYREPMIRLDLEMALAQVRATIQADCKLLALKIADGFFGFEVLVGEQDGAAEWEYTGAGNEELIIVSAIVFKGMGGAEIEDDVMWYPEPNRVDVLLEDYWAQKTEAMVRLFFEKNPVYQKAIQP